MIHTKPYIFVAAGAAMLGKGALYRLQPARTDAGPSWDGRGGTPSSSEASLPLTDRSLWEDRYVLCRLTLGLRNGARIEADNAVVSVSRTKHVVQTQLVGRSGSVKEYIGTSDADVSITLGIQAVDEDGRIADRYPEEGIRDLLALLDASESLEAYSPFLDLFGVSQLVVKSYTVRQDTASNVQFVGIETVSDDDYELYSEQYADKQQNP